MVFAYNTEILATFLNKKDSNILWWHIECRKDDSMLRYPADSLEWRNINRE
jgi:hypothetical protein